MNVSKLPRFRLGVLSLFKHTRGYCTPILTPKKAKSVSEVLVQDSIGLSFHVNGWVKSARIQKQNTFIDLVDGLTHDHLQVVIPSDKLPDKVSYHSAISVIGTLVKSNHPAQEFELIAESVDLITEIGPTTSQNEGQDEQKNYPFGPRKTYDDDFTRMFPMFRAKLTDFSALLRVRNRLTHAVNDYFRKEDFIQIHTPILTSNDCEGAGEVFTVLPACEKTIEAMKKADIEDGNCAYFDKNVYLTVSGQLHLEAMCNGLTKVYTFNQVFRSEKGRSRRHLSEFSMIEAELAFVYKIEEINQIIEALVKDSCSAVLKHNSEDILTYLKVRQGSEKKKNPSLDHVTKVIETPFVTMTYDEAMNTLEKNSEKFKSPPKRGGSLGKEHEIFLVEEFCQNTPVFVIDWPKSAKPFYARRNDDQTVAAVDLLFPYVGELCGGSLREHRCQILEDNIKESGAKIQALEWYLDLRKCGAAPMGGFGLGFERLVQYILNVKNIRDALPFPRAPHLCRM